MPTPFLNCDEYSEIYIETSYYLILRKQNRASGFCVYIFLWLGQKSQLPITISYRLYKFQITQTVMLTMRAELTQCAVHEAVYYRLRIRGVVVCWRRHSSRRRRMSGSRSWSQCTDSVSVAVARAQNLAR